MRTISEPSATDGKYLRINGLNPGDVILSFGGGKQSGWIASSTKGPFSHAAIVRNYMQRVEALDDGVGLTNHRIDRVEWDGDQPVLMMRLAEHPTVVLRHPAANTDDPASAIRFDRELYRLQGLPYADWPKLLNALPDDHPARPLVDMIQSGKNARDLLEGRFCSECVAETYGAMGWSLPGITLARVSPNDLWRLRSPHGPLEVREELIVASNDARLRQRDERWEVAVNELHRQFPKGRFGLDQMLKFKLEMSTIAARQQSAVSMFEQVFLDQIEMRRGTEQANEIPKLEEALRKLRDTAAKGRESARALGLNLPH